MASSSRLIQRTGPNPGSTFDLTQEVITIGRDVTNELVVADAEVSRQHARISRTPGGVVLEDLGSTNGTFVNGERLTAPRVLRSGDLVGMGENVTYTFDVVAPESEATVVGPPAQRAVVQPPPPEPVAAPQPPQPVASPPPPAPAPQQPAPGHAAVAAVEEGGAGSRNWILAGCGCLVLIVACAGFLWFMDANYPDLLYAPLYWLGF